MEKKMFLIQKEEGLKLRFKGNKFLKTKLGSNWQKKNQAI